MKKTAVLALLLLFARLCAAQTLPLYRNVKGENFAAEKAKFLRNDSILLHNNHGVISGLNLYTGEETVYYRADTAIVSFDVCEPARLLAVLDARKKLVAYHFEKNALLDSLTIDTVRINSCVKLSPTGGQLMLLQPDYNSWAGKDTALFVTLLNTVQLRSHRVLDYSYKPYGGNPETIVQADYFSDHSIILSLQSMYGTQNRLTAASADFTFDIPIPFGGISSLYFSVNARKKILLGHTEWFGGKYERAVMVRPDTFWNTSRKSILQMDFVNPKGMDLCGVNDQYIIQSGPRSIELWNVESYGALAGYQLEGAAAPHGHLTCSPDGKWFTTSDTSGGLNVYHYPDSLGKRKVSFSNIEIIPQRITSGYMRDFSYSHNIPALAFRESSGNIVIYDLKIRQKVKEINGGVVPGKFRLHPKFNNLLAIQGSSLRNISIYGSDNNIVMDDQHFSRFDLDTSGSKIAYQSFNEKTVRIADYPSGRMSKTIQVDADTTKDNLQNIWFTRYNGIIVESTLFKDSSNNTYYMRYYFAGDKQKEARVFFDGAESTGKPALSPDRRYFAAADTSRRITVFEIGEKYIRPIGSYDFRDSLLRHFPDEQITERSALRLHFLADTSLLVGSLISSNTYRFNFFHSGTLEKVDSGKGPFIEVVYPKEGNFYYKALSGAIDIYSKDNNSLYQHITNNFLTPFSAAFMSDDRAAIATDSLLLLFHINQMKIDSVISVADELSNTISLLKVDTTAQVVANAGSYGLLTACYGKSDTGLNNRRAYNFSDSRWVPPNGQNFALLTNKHLVAYVRKTISEETGWRLITRLSIHPEDDTAGLSPLYDTTLTGILKDVSYDSVHHKLYVLTGEYESLLHSSKMLIISLGPIRTEVKVFPGIYSYNFLLQPQQNRAYWLISDAASRISLLKTDPETWHSDTVRLEKWGYAMCYSPQNNRLIIGCSDGNVNIIDLYTNKVISTFTAHEGKVNSVSLSGQNRLLTVGSDLTVRYWDLDRLSLLGTLYLTGRSDFIFINSANYYMANKNSVKGISFKIGNRICPVQQFDKYANRPDIILSELDSTGNAKMIGLYQQAIRKRWGLRAAQPVPNLDVKQLPYARFNTARPVPAIWKESNRYTIRYTVSDTVSRLRSVNIFVNNVPVYGPKGLDLSNNAAQHIPLEENLYLSQGDNKIELVAQNMPGNESTHEIAYIRYEPKKKYKPTVYFIAMDVDRYRDSAFRLSYSVNDGRTIAEKLSGVVKNEELYIDTIFDANVTRDALERIRKTLQHTRVDDKVILQLSGHGMLDTARKNFYFCTYDTDFNHPAAKAIPYDSILALMHNIPARKKLILIDACHSGMLDSTKKYSTVREIADGGGTPGMTVETIKERSGPGSRVKRPFIGITLVGKGLEDNEAISFELMQDIFWNIDNSDPDGTFVFTATAGDKVAKETGTLGKGNGIFTYYLVQQLNKGVSIKQMAETVRQQVMDYTGQKQKPDMRKENIGIDWNIVD